MSAARQTLPLIALNPHDAQIYAKEILEIFAGTFEEAHIVGSCRRGAEMANDLELLMVPRMEVTAFNLFGDPVTRENLQYNRVQGLVTSGVLSKRPDKFGRYAFGRRYQRLVYRAVALDLFVCLPPAELGWLMFLRTGPTEFTERILRSLPIGWHSEAGALYKDGQLAPTPTEEDVFAALGLSYIAPENRK